MMVAMMQIHIDILPPSAGDASCRPEASKRGAYGLEVQLRSPAVCMVINGHLRIHPKAVSCFLGIDVRSKEYEFPVLILPFPLDHLTYLLMGILPA